jgi:hypothetical protein
MLHWIDAFVGHIMAFSHNLECFLIPMDDFRKGLIDFVATGINFFSGAESGLLLARFASYDSGKKGKSVVESKETEDGRERNG